MMNASIGSILFTKILEELIKWSAKRGAGNWLDNEANRQALAKAAADAGTCMESKPIDQKITHWLADLKMSDIRNMAEAIDNFRKTANYHVLAAPVRVKLQERGDLSPEEIKQGVDAFVNCLRQSLLQINDLAHPVIGSLILDAEKKFTRRFDALEDLVKKLPDEIESRQRPPLPPYTPPPLPPADKRDELPPHEPLPPGSRLPLPQNKVFTGREEQLQELADRLLYEPIEEAVGITQTEAVLGMGGIGKTQLAVEFCHRYGAYFKGVHWLNTTAGLNAEVAACGAEMNLPNWPETTPDQAALTLRAWAASPPRLIILDNLDGEDGPEVLAEWLPKLRGQRILVTSRREKWPADLPLDTRSLKTFTPEESRALLRALAPRLEAAPDDELDEIGGRFGHLPLAIDLAGRYLADVKLSPEKYLEALDKMGSALEHSSLKTWVKDKTEEKDRSVAASFLLSWERLEGEDCLSARLVFQAAGFCAPNIPIPQVVFQGVLVFHEGVEIKDDEHQLEAIADALNRLRTLGLLALDEKTDQPMMHPLLAEYARLHEKDAEVERALPPLASALAKLMKNANDTGFPANAAPLRPHCQTAAPRAEKADAEFAGALWNNLGYHLKIIAEYTAAENANRHALVIGEAALGPDHPFVAVILNNLGELLRAQGDLAGAMEHFERALAIDENKLGSEDPDVATILNNLGLVLQAQGDLAGAMEHFERALAIDEAAFGSENPKVAIRLNNLGAVLKTQGDLAGAMEHYRRALNIWEKALGKDHEKVAIILTNLGALLQAQGNLAGAMEHYRRAQTIFEQVLGRDHPNVALPLNNLGEVLRSQGDLAGAKNHFERALRIFEASLPEGHPNIDIVRRFLFLVDEQMRGEPPSEPK